MHLVCCCDRAVKSAKLLRCKGNFPSNESARNGGCCRLTIYRFSPIATRFPLNIWWCARSFSHSSFSVPHSISINPSFFCLLSFFTTFFHSAWHWYFLLWTLFFYDIKSYVEKQTHYYYANKQQFYVLLFILFRCITFSPSFFFFPSSFSSFASALLYFSSAFQPYLVFVRCWFVVSSYLMFF